MGRPISVSSSVYGNYASGAIAVILEQPGSSYILATAESDDQMKALEADALITAEINDGDDDNIFLHGRYSPIEETPIAPEEIGEHIYQKFQIKEMTIDGHRIIF